MCKPTLRHPTRSKKTKSKSVVSKGILVISSGLALALALFPVFVSEIAGGWTKKYTSNHPIFKVADMNDLTGQVAIVTGSNTGIGFHTALELARHGATVVVAARSSTKGEGAVKKIKKEISMEVENPEVRFVPLDLASLESVHNFAETFRAYGLPLHSLVLNAGIMKSPGQQFVGQPMTYGYDVTKDGFEAHIGVNHIGHFYLTMLLRDVLVSSAPSRVISVSSMAEEGAYPEEGIRFDTWKAESVDAPDGYEDGVAYAQSKMANILFAKELAEQLSGTGVTAYSCHPGVITTELGRYMEEKMKNDSKKAGWIGRQTMNFFSWFWEQATFSAADGALTQLQLTVADPKTLQNGAFYHPIGNLIGDSMHPQGTNSTLRKLLWTETERMIQEAGF